jgi:hypothetical protein
MLPLQIACWFALCCFSLPAMAETPTVYRCGSTYSPVACAGAEVVVRSSDVRTPEQKSAADKSTKKIRIQANAMEKARLKQEAAALGLTQAQIKAKSKAKPKAKPKVKLTDEAKALKKEEARQKANSKAREKYQARKEAKAAAGGSVYKPPKPKMFVAKVVKPAKN